MAAMMEIKREAKNNPSIASADLVVHSPVIHATAEAEKTVRKFSDPSSSTRNNRYPIPSFFQQRLQMNE